MGLLWQMGPFGKERSQRIDRKPVLPRMRFLFSSSGHFQRPGLYPGAISPPRGIANEIGTGHDGLESDGNQVRKCCLNCASRRNAELAREAEKGQWLSPGQIHHTGVILKDLARPGTI
jgi:hypothetical protein